jgi:hypothetical protein
MKHPVTGEELDPAWESLDSLPKPTGKAAFVCLVLMAEQGRVHKSHIGIASIHTNVTTINGNFAFDMPNVLAWRRLPKIFKEN